MTLCRPCSAMCFLTVRMSRSWFPMPFSKHRTQLQAIFGYPGIANLGSMNNVCVGYNTEYNTQQRCPQILSFRTFVTTSRCKTWTDEKWVRKTCFKDLRVLSRSNHVWITSRQNSLQTFLVHFFSCVSLSLFVLIFLSSFVFLFLSSFFFFSFFRC